MHHRPDSEDDTGQGGRSPRRSSRSRRLAKAALLGGFVALLTRTGVRGRVLDALFGPEEEFEYESETEPEPLTDLSADPADAAEDSEDHDEEHDAPAEDDPRDVARAPWQPPPAPDVSPQDAVTGRPGGPTPATEEPGHQEAPEAPYAPRISALPSEPATEPDGEQADTPAAAEIAPAETPPPYIRTPPPYLPRTPPVSYLPDDAVSSDADGDTEALEEPSVVPEPPAHGSDEDERYSWGGDAAVEVLAPAAGEEPSEQERSPDAGPATISDPPAPAVTDRPLPRGDELATPYRSPGGSPSPGGVPPRTSSATIFSRDVQSEAPAREPTQAGPLSDSIVEPLAQVAVNASDDDAAPESGSWAVAPPFVIGGEPSGRAPVAEPWRTAPSIVIENGDLIEDRGSAPVSTPWNSSDTNGGKTPRPWTSPDLSQRPGDQRSPSGTIALDDGATPATDESRPAESLLRDPPRAAYDAPVTTDEPTLTATIEPTDAAPESSPALVSLVPRENPPDLKAEGPVAPSASAWSRGESAGSTPVVPGEAPDSPSASATSPMETAGSADTAVPGETQVPGDGAVAATASAESPGESAESVTASTTSAETSAAPAASAESAAAATPTAPVESPVATAERAEPAIGEAAPRRSGWWLSRRRRGPGPEPPRWD